MKFFLILMLTVVSLSGFGGANFTSDKKAGCPPLVVNFSDLSNINPTSWSWDFNNGNTSNYQNPSAVFLTSGVYTVSLIASNGTQSDTFTKTITVYKLPEVNFSASKPNNCFHDTVAFTSNVTPGDAGIAQYAWGFGNGVASNVPNAHYLYNQLGLYNITLVVLDSNGCTANLTKPAYIHVFALPVAAFTASPNTSCMTTQLVSFTNQSSGSNLSYFWHLDNTATSTNANPTYLYPQEITTAKLFVTDSNGCTSSANQQITISPLSAAFTASKTQPCTGEKVAFINSSNIQGTAWHWDFGDGTTSPYSSPQHAYQTAGIYTVKFKVSNPGCSDSVTKPNYMTVKTGFTVSTATFAADSQISCGQPLHSTFTNTTPTGNGDTYHWVFGDGDTSNVQNPTNLYSTPGNYTVILTITDSNGCVISGTQSNFIQTARPSAKFSVDSTACLGSIVTFKNQSTNSQGFIWYFGDGDTAYVANPTHQYLAEGSYTVTLRAFSAGGCDTTIVMPNCVKVTKVHIDFHVNATFSPCPPFVCILTNQSDTKANKFLYDFGDGYTDTAANPTHIYFFPGVYTVKLIGHTPQGCLDTMVYPNLITVQGPTALFTVSPKAGCMPLQVNIQATPSSNTKMMWCDLGDGTVIHDTADITHTYNQARVYHPQYILTDYVGCTVPYPLDSITVFQIPQLQVSDTSVCSGATVSINATSDVSDILWSPATLLNCATCKTVTLTPTDSMVYIVTTTNGLGCMASQKVYVNAVPLPVLNDSVSARLCPGDSKKLFTGNASQVTWSPSTYLSDSTAAVPVCTPAASITYTVTAANSLGCKVTAQVPVTVKDKVEVSLPSSVNVCTNGNVNLPTSLIFASDLGANFDWDKAQYLNDPTSSDPLASPGTISMEFIVVVSSGHCIPDTQTVYVTVVVTPDIEVSSTITTTPMADVPLYAASHQELTYHWFAKDSLSCTECRRTNLFPTQSQLVYVEGTNSTGCSVKDSVLVDVTGCDGKSIYLPNTFTPNGDGLNDKFLIRTSSLSSLKYFRIFNEWGEMVFETNNLNEGWDGNISGKLSSQAVYVYVLEGKCQDGYDVIKTGNVTAIR